MRDHIFEEIEFVTIDKKVEFIEAYLHEHSLTILLWGVKLQKSSYFEFINRKESKQKTFKKETLTIIKEIWSKSHEIFGARKIQKELEKIDIHISERTVGNYMKELGIRSIYRIKYRPKSTKSTSDGNCFNYLLTEEVNTPHTHIVTDITYLNTTNDGWTYQLTFLDACTRKVLHCDISDKMDDEFVSGNAAILIKKYNSIKMIHSDRGSQYTSNRYRRLLKDNGIKASYSAPGYPYHNAIIESYHASLKIEWIYRMKLRDINEVKRKVFEYNYGFYNTRRIHQSLKYMTPNEYERTYA